MTHFIECGAGDRRRSGLTGCSLPISESAQACQNQDDFDKPVETPARRGFSISYMGKTLLSRVDPVAQGERAAAEAIVKEWTLYLCPSPLYGYGLDVFLTRLPENSALLCVEADRRLFEISEKSISLSETYSSKDFTKFALIFASSPHEVCVEVIKIWGKRRFRAVEELRLGGGRQLFEELYKSFTAVLRQEISLEWGNAMTLIRLGRLYARNLIRNLSGITDAQEINERTFGSSPVLVLGAGPSLDETLDQLSSLFTKTGINIKQTSNRPFKIVCVDTCLQALHKREIPPNLVVILESQHWNLRDFSGAKGRAIDAAIDLSALPPSALVLNGKRYFFATPWTELSLFSRLYKSGLMPETFLPLGSVALTAVAFALRSGSGTVLTAGIDFSFSLDFYHARGTPSRLERERTTCRTKSLINFNPALREGTFSAVSKNGMPVRSDPAMRTYALLFHREYGGNRRLLDIEGQGVSLGVRTIPVTEAFVVLSGGEKPLPVSCIHENKTGKKAAAAKREKTAAFVKNEIEALQELKSMLKGEAPLSVKRLEELLDFADYLWAHFPESAGSGGRRPQVTDESFLKRVRTEINPFIKRWETTILLMQPENGV